MTGRVEYAVLSHLTWGDQTFEPGATVEMEPDDAAPLLADGVLSDGNPEQPAEPGAIAAVLEQALEALRTAPAEDVLQFVERLRDDPEIEGKMAAAFSREDRIERIAAAIGQLDPENANHWLADGKTPAIAALENESGVDVITAADRDAAIALREAAAE